MSSRPPLHTVTAVPEPSGLSRPMLFVMTIAAGAGVANLYYCQPLLEQMARTMGASEDLVGMVPTLTQIGYAIGMLLLVPLGDMLSRRRLALLFTGLAAAMAVGMAISQSMPVLLCFSFLLGIANMTPQLLVPYAASLSRPDQRGRVVGTILSGIFVGVLLSRTIAGLVGDMLGWRAMFWLAAGLLILLALALATTLPETRPTYRGRYGELLWSVFDLFRSEPTLREACLFGATLFASFMVFWSSLIHLMVAPPFNLGATAVGLFGILGAFAALASPIVGRLADRGFARNVAGAMVVLTILSFGVFWFGRSNLIWIGIGVLMMDLGVQLAHVSNQSRILNIGQGAHSRIQTAYMTAYFGGGGIGAAVGSIAWARWEWAGVCGVALLILMIPLIRWLLPALASALVV